MSASESNPLKAPHGQTKLDRWMEALLGDSLPKHFGSGWLSGVFGVLLGLGSFLAVLVFRYPHWLTASETAPRYPIETMRVILALAIVASFLLSALNILLRPSKRLGLTGLFFCMAAVLAGGSTVEVGSGTAAFRVGLDWFILNVVLLAVVFIPLERLFPLNAEQGTFRPGWTTDGIYFLISHVAVELLTFFTLLPATLIARSVHAEISGIDPSVLPLAVEVLAVMLVADLTQYAVHRTFHSVGWLWPFHAIHHSSRTLDWLAGSRLHLVDIIVTRALILVPLFALGFSQMALYIWLVIVAVQATLNHVNIRFDVPDLEPTRRPAALSSLAPCDEAGGQELRRTLPLDRPAVRHLSHAQRGVAAGDRHRERPPPGRVLAAADLAVSTPLPLIGLVYRLTV